MAGDRNLFEIIDWGKQGRSLTDGQPTTARDYQKTVMSYRIASSAAYVFSLLLLGSYFSNTYDAIWQDQLVAIEQQSLNFLALAVAQNTTLDSVWTEHCIRFCEEGNHSALPIPSFAFDCKYEKHNPKSHYYDQTEGFRLARDPLTRELYDAYTFAAIFLAMYIHAAPLGISDYILFAKRNRDYKKESDLSKIQFYLLPILTPWLVTSTKTAWLSRLAGLLPWLNQCNQMTDTKLRQDEHSHGAFILPARMSPITVGILIAIILYLPEYSIIAGREIFSDIKSLFTLFQEVAKRKTFEVRPLPLYQPTPEDNTNHQPIPEDPPAPLNALAFARYNITDLTDTTKDLANTDTDDLAMPLLEENDSPF